MDGARCKHTRVEAFLLFYPIRAVTSAACWSKGQVAWVDLAAATSQILRRRGVEVEQNCDSWLCFGFGSF